MRLPNQPSSTTFLLYVFPLSLGLLIAWVSLTLRFDTRSDTIHNLSAVLQGQPFRFGEEILVSCQFYNRVIFAILLEFLSQGGSFLSSDQWFLLLRIVCFQGVFIAFAIVCLRYLHSTVKDYHIAAMALALSIIVSFNHGWEEPSDALDLFALSMGTLACLTNRYILAMVLGLGFAANRESAAFIGAIWVFLGHPSHTFKRRILEGAAISAGSFLCAILLRMYVYGADCISNDIMVLYNARITVDAIASLNPLHWLALLVAIISVLGINIDLNDDLARRFVGLAALFAAAALCFGAITELRVFLPSFLMLALAAAGHGARRH